MPLDHLRDLMAVPGPYATAYIPADSADPQAATTMTTHWRNQRRDLEQAGAPAETLAAMDDAVGVDTEAVERRVRPAEDNVFRSVPLDVLGDHASGEAAGDLLCVIARDGEVVADVFTETHPVAGQSWWAPLPAIVPLVELQQRGRAHLIVLIDRRGADVWGVDRDGSIVTADEVEGETFQLTKVNQGFLNQERIHRRAVNRWTANARLVLDHVVELARGGGFEAIFVAGEREVVGTFRDDAPGDVAELVTVLDAGARGPESGMAGVHDEVARRLADLTARHTSEVIQRLREGIGRGDGAVEGLAPTVGALQMANVDTLLVAHGDEGTLWFGPEGTQVALDQGFLDELGVESPVQGSAVDVAVRSALLTGADIRVVPSSVVQDGFGAILRSPVLPQ